MLWARSELMEVYLSERLLGLKLPGGQGSRWIDIVDVNSAIAHLEQSIVSEDLASVGYVRVWLSSALSRPFLVPAVAGARSKREANALAIAMASEATGMDGTPRIWLDRWRADVSTMAVAMPETVWSALQGLVAGRRAWRAGAPRRRRVRELDIASVRPWWNFPLDELLAQKSSAEGAIGWSMQDEDGVLSGMIERGAVMEAGFERRTAHDPAGTLLRRRLEANWSSTAQARHLVFEREAENSLPIGAWSEIRQVAA